MKIVANLFSLVLQIHCHVEWIWRWMPNGRQWLLGLSFAELGFFLRLDWRPEQGLGFWRLGSAHATLAD